MSSPQPAPAPICARCNRPLMDHVAMQGVYSGRLWLCPTALYHPLSSEAPPEAENWTEPAPAVKEQP